jgi:hypothetical protein
LFHDLQLSPGRLCFSGLLFDVFSRSTSIIWIFFAREFANNCELPFGVGTFSCYVLGVGLPPEPPASILMHQSSREYVPGPPAPAQRSAGLSKILVRRHRARDPEILLLRELDRWSFADVNITSAPLRSPDVACGRSAVLLSVLSDTAGSSSCSSAAVRGARRATA